MAEFFITIKSVDNQHGHQIHKSNCVALPDFNTLKYLGSYASASAAQSKSRGYFDQVSFCPTCFKP